MMSGDDELFDEETSEDEEEQTMAPDRMNNVKRLLREAILKRQFPTQIACPEYDRTCSLATSLFSPPVFVSVPECLNVGQKPHCVNNGCSCAPRLKEYRQRVCDDIDFKCHVLYIKYQCMGTREPKSCFSTIFDDYLRGEVPTMLTHDGMMSANGLSRTVENVLRRREQRYYNLCSLFADRVRQSLLVNPKATVPQPPTVEQYSERQCKLSARMLRDVWLHITEICSALRERLMKTMRVSKALRIDHSVKFCKRLKLWEGGSGKRESVKDAKVLLLIQNEVGQIVGRRLTRSENNDEMRALLLDVKPAFVQIDDVPICVVSDNANAVRNLVNDVFDGEVKTKQDPFHVMQRFSEKIKHKGKRKSFYKKMQKALHSVEGQLRNPDDMADRLREIVKNVNPDELSCSQKEWSGCLNSKLKQIACEDLYMHENTHVEGGTSVSLVSTSQLEGFHFALKRLLNKQISCCHALFVYCQKECPIRQNFV
ncbi:LOW QUALITY PROTEIN: Hypothetical protein PHPALM_3343 [Phytophthora palmivora]|uniref:Uncharacterized protein n=1 Tax=Phytophthora palmivora TaxID=4796 RepID=A0A2P4YMM5_9STRA|nr:LOW QUALITY PROTEIN: Hypothetical protein PHPALM_3343 [Phytophthora palmivora]